MCPVTVDSAGEGVRGSPQGQGGFVCVCVCVCLPTQAPLCDVCMLVWRGHWPSRADLVLRLGPGAPAMPDGEGARAVAKGLINAGGIQGLREVAASQQVWECLRISGPPRVPVPQSTNAGALLAGVSGPRFLLWRMPPQKPRLVWMQELEQL